MTSQPKSYVGILGVDQSVLLLKGGNDFQKSMVSEEMQLYGSIDRYNFEWRENTFFNYYTDVSMANAVIMTNAKEEYSKYSRFFKIIHKILT